MPISPRILAATALMTALAVHTVAPCQAPPEVVFEVVNIPDPSQNAKPARVEKVVDQFQIPSGVWTVGGYEDTLLANDFANILIGAVPPPAESRVRGGHVLDVFTSPSAPENFEIFQPTTSIRFAQSVVVDSLNHQTDPDGSATVTTLARDPNIPGLTFSTTYRMEKGWPGARVTTTYTNDGDQPATLPIVGDYVGWGAMPAFFPSVGWVNTVHKELTKIEFVFGRLFDSIVYLHPIGQMIEAEHYVSHTVMIYGRDVVLEKGQSKTIDRWLLTTQRDPARLLSFVNERAGNHGVMAGRIVERRQLPDGAITETADVPDSEVRISIWNRKGLPAEHVGRPYIYGMSNHIGQFQVSLPEGEYRVNSAHPARLYVPEPTTVKVRPGKVSALDYGVSMPATVTFEVFDAATGDPLPAKLSFLPLRGSDEPDFGPPGGARSFNAVLTHTGRGVVDVPPGDYRIVASHGNEYQSRERRVRVTTMTDERVRFELVRAFETEGWISADLGVMTSNTPTSRISMEDRVISAAAEGVQWIVTADANVATDLQPIVEKLGLQNFVRASRGLRITSTATQPRGDYTLFPVDMCASASPDFTRVLASTTPAGAVDALRAICPAAMLVANRPLFPTYGLLSLLGYNTETGTVPMETDLFGEIDGMQVWEGKRQTITRPTIQAFETLLAAGHRMVPIGNSLSAGTYNEEIGYPRVYIRSNQTNPAKLDPQELVAALKAGRVQITNGPFIDFKVNGEGPGSMITDDDGSLDVELNVYTPNWANVNSVTILQSGRVLRQILIPSASIDRERAHVFPPATKPEDSNFKLRLREDAILSVVIEGDASLPQDPVNPFQIFGRSGTRGQTTYAYTAPILVDMDGNGRLDIRPREKTPTTGEHVPPF